MKQVATNPEVMAGVPDKTPAQSGKAHSLTPEYWSKLNDMKWEAVKAAKHAGEDPAKVYESLTAMQTAHFQGQVLKQAATASRAFDAGNMDAVTQALKNINYYLPDGQDIDVKKATAADVAKDPTLKVGDLLHSNPYSGMYGHEHEPDYIKVDQAYIQSLGQGALDPQKMQQAQMGRYTASMEAQEKMTTAKGALATGTGRQLVGAAQWKNIGLKEQNQDVTRRLMIAQGDNAESLSRLHDREPVTKANSGAPKVSLAQLRGAQDDAIKYFNDVVQGQNNPVPTMIPNPDKPGTMMPNSDMHAGTSQHDPKSVPPIFQPMAKNPAMREEAGKMAANIYGSNLGSPGMDKATAAEIGARITTQEAHPTTHPNPATHKQEKDMVFDQANGTVHLWIGNGWKKYYMTPNVIGDDAPAGQGIPTQSGGGGGGGGAQSEANEGAEAFNPD